MTELKELVTEEKVTATDWRGRWPLINQDSIWRGIFFNFNALISAEEFSIYPIDFKNQEDDRTIAFYADDTLTAVAPRSFQYKAYLGPGCGKTAAFLVGWQEAQARVCRTFLAQYVQNFVQPEIQVGREFDASYFIWTVKDICEAAETKTVRVRNITASKAELSETALHRLASAFWRFEKVKSVYVQRFRGEFQISVLLLTEHYDHDLMDHLLDAEYDVRKALSDVVFVFAYTPIGLQAHSETKHPSARRLFTR